MPRLSIRAIIIEDEKILLCRHETDGEIWYVTPGGGVDHGETIEEAFHREMLEESGVECEFGNVEFIREIISDRHQQCGLKQGFHQVEVFVRSRILEDREFHTPAPDPDQVGVEWIGLSQLDDITFYPTGLTEAFRTTNWEKIYYGEIR